MNPALSIIFFSTASGAGFGLLLLVGVAAPLGLVPQSAGFALVSLGLATVLAVAGLASSTLHLGRPERAWRAFSQWRSSWLSREGVFAVLTFVPALIFGIGWFFFGRTGGVFGLCGILAAALAGATIFSTGMIYATLKPIHQWHNRWVVPNYLLLGLMAGLLLLDLIVRFWARPVGIPLLTLAAIALAWWLKERYWRFIDISAAPSSVAGATGLGRRGTVRLLEPPNTEENYLLKEMGFRIARKHRVRLRVIARVAAFVVPLLATLVALLLPSIVFALVAVLSAGLGLVVERWLFFAEAKHTVMLYYGAETV
ncbi:MAG TPA: DmsC/YnfH family molybdoenzyme membrane anchor subunit [Stellaceae bacterium]|nr:DmsC/YnfH family molybdoenzyme membrane anchor subunit [Stellaceae bacterium]